MGQLRLDRGVLCIVEVLVIKFSGPYQVWLASQLGKAVEHQHTATTAVSTHLKPSAIRGKRVRSNFPGQTRQCGRPDKLVLRSFRNNWIGSDRFVVVLVIVEDQFEQP